MGESDARFAAAELLGAGGDGMFPRFVAQGSYFVLRVKWKTMGVSLSPSRQVQVSVM